MADVDEDALLTSHVHSQSNDDNDPSDETQDFRLLAALTSKLGQIPKRGEKDFEPHGTKHQDGILESSRNAMHEALSYKRIHTPKNHIRAFYYGEESLRRDDVVAEEWRRGLSDDHVVVVETSKGPYWKTLGTSVLGKPRSSIWLLPEEALYLVERGNLDLWWPAQSSFNGMVNDDEEEGNTTQLEVDTQDEVDEGFPMSLQAAYAALIGKDGERGKISLDRYTVYTNLRRNGYVVFRAPESDPTKLGQPHSFQVSKAKAQEDSPSMFTLLFSRLFAESQLEPLAFGPLVKPGMHRSYNAIYRQIAIIPRHKPSAAPENPSPSAGDPYRVIFHLWKPSNIPNFAKTNPGPPDFRLAIADARASYVPSLTEITSLLESTPWDPPNTEKLIGPTKVYQRLKHGWRNVILAVIDQGVISYLRLGETAFGEEKLCERFDRANTGGNKRGGGAGRGEGRGRGRRGRGRGR